MEIKIGILGVQKICLVSVNYFKAAKMRKRRKIKFSPTIKSL